ncbi:uncharacterized protein BDR25DRAFT_89219 [Lindgomyces ingoldianus]|uniref:Uncharacterized protein n=1 Tax=Lindgomyces ingoldianus TaxID=673940 RepID=A0ACB6R9F5_9PLEO|nr:uncharacterized protein BDR25DRAFT_89219 [Lindgomyces ingoldianus]KAF2475884.1 hypothetical protein BDR25DRAFT_89219 [Lindgomyces ingoldianus]
MSSALRETATRFISAFKDLSTEDHLALRTSDCLHIFAPASLNLPAPQSNDAFAEHLGRLRLIIEHFPVTAKEIHVNEPCHQAVIWATGQPEFRSEVMGKDPIAESWKYTGEYVFILDLDDTCLKIKRIVEFLDSKGTEKLLRMTAKARENLETLNVA